MRPVTLLGETEPAGSYVLHVLITQPLRVRFGHFRQGRPVAVPKGVCLYVGSARARRGASSLAHRLLRHARRTPPRSPHPIYPKLAEALDARGMLSLGQTNARPKRLHWHIDYLLDDPGSTLNAVLALRTAADLEAPPADLLAEHPAIRPLAPGLGASDAPGRTHLFFGPHTPDLWPTLVRHANRLLKQPSETP